MSVKNALNTSCWRIQVIYEEIPLLKHNINTYLPLLLAFDRQIQSLFLIFYNITFLKCRIIEFLTCWYFHHLIKLSVLL